MLKISILFVFGESGATIEHLIPFLTFLASLKADLL